MVGEGPFEVEACRLRSLTSREREVVVLIAEGRPEKEVARRLRSSSTDVGHQLSEASRKLGVESRLELIILCYRHRLVVPLIESQADGNGDTPMSATSGTPVPMPQERYPSD